jgi:hypothetical protein
MLNDLVKAVDDACATHKVLSDQLTETQTDIMDQQTEAEVLDKAVKVMREGAKLSQAHIATHLSGIVTKAIRTVIEKPYEFKIEFVERRGVTEADLYVTLGGHRVDILGGTGGGLADVCSFTLKVAYLLLSGEDRVLVIDEIARHINSPEQRAAFAEVVKALCKEFAIQVIITTAVDEFVDIADKVITVTQINGESRCQ